MEVNIPLDAGTARVTTRLGLGLVGLGVLAVAWSLTGGTHVAGVPLLGPVGAIVGVALIVPGLLLWRWVGGSRTGGPAIWADGDVLYLHAHAGPVLQVHIEDLVEVTDIRTPGSAPLRVLFGARMFLVRSTVNVSRGMIEMPVGERFVGVDLDVARDQILAWARGRPRGAPDHPS